MKPPALRDYRQTNHSSGLAYELGKFIGKVGFPKNLPRCGGNRLQLPSWIDYNDIMSEEFNW